MKCERFIANYTTGSFLDRTRARLHATRCPKCAATRNWLGQVESELRSPAELTLRHKSLWEQAADVDEPQPAKAWFSDRRLVWTSSLAVAAALVVMAILSIPDREKSPRPGQISSLRGGSTIVTTTLKVPADQIVELEKGLGQLGSDIDRLAEEADRVQARQAIRDLAASYQPLGAPDSI